MRTLRDYFAATAPFTLEDARLASCPGICMEVLLKNDEARRDLVDFLTIMSFEYADLMMERRKP